VIALEVFATGRRLLEKVAPRRGRLIATLALALATAGLLAMHARRALRFRSAPTVPMASVQARFQSTFVRWAEELGLPGATVLTPDVGGPLWSRNLRVLDLGGLCDETIARALRRDPQQLCDYVFEELRPTFIAFHDTWGGQTGLPFDPRLSERYFAIHSATYFDEEGTAFPVGTFVAKGAVPDAERARQLGAR
jgi:hypothetical protein